MNSEKKRILSFLTVSILLLAATTLVIPNLVSAQSSTLITGDLSGGNSSNTPVQLNKGDVLQITIKSVGDNLSFSILDPGGNRVFDIPARIGLGPQFQASVTGEHFILIKNTNYTQVRKQHYEITYEITLASSAIDISQPLYFRVGALSGGNSNNIFVDLNKGEGLKIIFNIAGNNLTLTILDPTGKEVLSPVPVSVGSFGYQATTSGRYCVVIRNRNTIQVKKEPYELYYDVLPASSMPALLPPTVTSSSTPKETSGAASSFVSNIITIGITMVILMVVIPVVLMQRRTRSNTRPGGDTNIIVNINGQETTTRRSDIQRGLDWHVPQKGSSILPRFTIPKNKR